MPPELEMTDFAVLLTLYSAISCQNEPAGGITLPRTHVRVWDLGDL